MFFECDSCRKRFWTSSSLITLCGDCNYFHRKKYVKLHARINQMKKKVVLSDQKNKLYEHTLKEHGINKPNLNDA